MKHLCRHGAVGQARVGLSRIATSERSSVGWEHQRALEGEEPQKQKQQAKARWERSTRTYASGGRSAITWPSPRQLDRPTQTADFIRQLGIVSLHSRQPQAEVFGICLGGHTPLVLVLDLVLELLYICPQTLLALREQICGAVATVYVVGWPGRHSRMAVVVRRRSNRWLLALSWVRFVLETGQCVRSW